MNSSKGLNKYLLNKFLNKVNPAHEPRVPAPGQTISRFGTALPTATCRPPTHVHPRTAFWGGGGAYLYCQPFVLPPRLLLLLLLLTAPPQPLLLLFLFGVTAVANASSFPSISETFITDAGSPPCIFNPKFICPSRAGGRQLQRNFGGTFFLYSCFHSERDLRPRRKWKPSGVQKKMRTRISTSVQTFKEHRYPSEGCLS